MSEKRALTSVGAGGVPQSKRVSVTSGGSQVYAGGAYPSISADGTYVTFTSGAPDLVAGDTNGVVDVFLRRVQLRR